MRTSQDPAVFGCLCVRKGTSAVCGWSMGLSQDAGCLWLSLREETEARAREPRKRGRGRSKATGSRTDSRGPARVRGIWGFAAAECQGGYRCCCGSHGLARWLIPEKGGACCCGVCGATQTRAGQVGPTDSALSSWLPARRLTQPCRRLWT